MTGHPPAPRAEWAYFFDIDGTLSELAPSPSTARVGPEIRRLLDALHRRAGGAVAAISGRTLADVDLLLGGLVLPAAGQHGAERRDVAGRITTTNVSPAALDPARRALRHAAARHPALLVEDKGQSLALHYRAAPRLASFAHRLVRAQQHALGDALGAAFAVQPGKFVVELVVASVDKGSAMRAFMNEPPFQGRTPVFLGDDVSDELAFAAVDSLGGLSVKVGAGRSRARWRLDDVAAVRTWLRSITAPDRIAHGIQ